MAGRRSRPRFANLEALIAGHGDITVGAIGPIPCAATACDEDQPYAMLQRRPSESLLDLLARLDTAVAWAWENEDMIDEINTAPAGSEKPARTRAHGRNRKRSSRDRRGGR